MINDKTLSHLHVILGNMCRYVEANYKETDFDSKQWYQGYTWDNEKEDHFKNWLTDYIYGVREAQRELYGRTAMRKYECEQAASMFVFNYGWSLRSKKKEKVIE